MTLEILENNTEGNDDLQLCVLHNVDVIPSIGHELVIKCEFYKVESFLWHIEDGHVSRVTIWVDKS
jgi:hypothetical protein